MFRVTCLATLPLLAFVVATPASAQYLDGHVHEYFAYDHWHSEGVYAPSYFHGDHYGYWDDCYGDGHLAYPPLPPSGPRLPPLCDEVDCPYAQDIRCPNLSVCPLRCGRTRPGELIEEFPPEVGSGNQRHDHSHAGDNDNGHSHSQQIPNGDTAPADPSYLAPPSLPSKPMNNSPSRYQGTQVQPDGSIRIDGPPPSFPSPSSGTSRQDARSRHFESPPPATL